MFARRDQFEFLSKFMTGKITSRMLKSALRDGRDCFRRVGRKAIELSRWEDHVVK